MPHQRKHSNGSHKSNARQHCSMKDKAVSEKQPVLMHIADTSAMKKTCMNMPRGTSLLTIHNIHSTINRFNTTNHLVSEKENDEYAEHDSKLPNLLLGILNSAIIMNSNKVVGRV